jgi:hypothetical protein
MTTRADLVGDTRTVAISKRALTACAKRLKRLKRRAVRWRARWSKVYACTVRLRFSRDER